MTPPILPDLAQAFWETKLFVSILLVALGTPPCCPCLQQFPSCLSKACSVSKSSHKTLALKPFSGDAYPWLLSQAGTGSTETCLQDGRGSKRTKISQFQSLALSGVFKVEMFTTASFLGGPFSPPKWKGLMDVGVGCLGLVLCFSMGAGMGKGE